MTDIPQKIKSGLGWLMSKVGLTLAIVGMGTLLVMLVHRRIYAHLLNNEDYMVDLDQLAVVTRPAWAGAGIERGLTEVAPLTGRVSIFDENLVPALVEYYESNPWVAQVVSVEKEYPATVRVRVRLRKPLAAVENRGYCYLVDRDGVRLPGKYAHENLPRLPFYVPKVIGVTAPPPEPGSCWDDAAVLAGTTVAEVLVDQGVDKMMHIVAIDVANVNGRINRGESEVTIWAEENVPIQWGRAPSTDKYGELDVDQKIRNLKLILMGAPRLRGLKLVKLQFQRPTVATK
ncbi:MAG: hypothetical protein RDV41_07725 [Planctomycetota bacterium]|nr:hypothetical protein [Planctomycetota bacterium]